MLPHIQPTLLSFTFRNPTHCQAVLRLVELAPLLLEVTESSTIDVRDPYPEDPVVREMRTQLVRVARAVEEALVIKKDAYGLPENPVALPDGERLHAIADACQVLLDTLLAHVREADPVKRNDLGNLFEAHWRRLKGLLASDDPTNPTPPAPRFRRRRVLPKGAK